MDTATSEATLSNGDKVTVHTIYSSEQGFYNGRAKLFGYMPDSNTIVTVMPSFAEEQKMNDLIKTLANGKMPPSI